jgi:hypothetical protein
MRVLLKEGAHAATSDSILVPPQLRGSTLETLSGDPVSKGVLTEIDGKALTSALEAAAQARADEFISVKALLNEVRSLAKGLADYELGSKIGLKPTPRGFALDDSEARRINRAEGLTKGDTIAIGPTITPRTLMNARGRVVSIKGDKVTVELDAGDRDRFERATGKQIAEREEFPLLCVEKVATQTNP